MGKHWAAQYVGIPFRYRGRNRQGCDCYGLVCLVFLEQWGIRLPDYRDEYGDLPSEDELMPLFAEGVKEEVWTGRKEPHTGDVVLLMRAGLPLHCGIMLDGLRMLHVTERTTACVERLDNTLWSRRVLGYYRHKDLPNG